jgi:prepilin-type N-terminal cleavage/methylation domain-containing protein
MLHRLTKEGTGKMTVGASRRPVGLTLTEVLVSLAIVAILSAMALPAVQQAREAAPYELPTQFATSRPRVARIPNGPSQLSSRCYDCDRYEQQRM